MSLAAFLAFAGLVIFAAVSPGPAVLMSARTCLLYTSDAADDDLV